jgi:hypothetical protein
MRWAVPVVLLGLVGVALAACDQRRAWRFGAEDAGKLPAGWKAEQAGIGTGSVWKVVADDTAPSGTGHVLAQTAASPKAFIALCVAEDACYQDLVVSVAFRAVRGVNHQGGGVVWRYRDCHHYYLARVDARGDNVRVYKMVRGRRIELGSKDDLPINEAWHTLRAEMRGDRIRCYLDGTEHLRVRDSTFSGAGKVGLWTKGDARTYFDDFKITTPTPDG